MRAVTDRYGFTDCRNTHCEYSTLPIVTRARLRFGESQTYYIAASIGVGRRTAKLLCRKDGNRNAGFCTMAGKAIARRAYCMYLLSHRRPIRYLQVAIMRGPRLINGKIFTVTIFCTQARFSSISSRMRGSTSAGIQDPFMREKRSDYFENSRQATYIQREYALRNPHGFRGLRGKLLGPVGRGRSGAADSQSRWPKPPLVWLYRSWRAIWTGRWNDRSSPRRSHRSSFAPEMALAAMRHFREQYPEAVKEFRLPSGINPTLAGRRIAMLDHRRSISVSTRALSC